MFWFVFGMTLFQIITAVESAYTFTGTAAQVVDLLKAVVAYHPVFALVGWLVWGYINSSRRSVRTYETY